MANVNGTATNRRLVPALDRGLLLLRVLAESSDPQTGADLCRATGLPRTTVHDLLYTLVALDYAREIDPQLHSFALGPRVVALGHSYLAGLDLSAEADRVVRKVSQVTGETVQVAVLDGADVMYVAKAESRNTLRLVSAVGRRLPAHLTGVGKALLAHQPDAELEGLFEDPEHLPTMTPNSIDTLSRLKTELRRVRKQGYAEDHCESNPDVACVAAAITGEHGQVAAAISISFPVTRDTEAYRKELLAQVLEASQELSHTLGADSV
jgi:IclR family KDG regulon transcriptional repressor